MQPRLEDSLKYAARHYVPEQNLQVGLYDLDSNITQNPGLKNQKLILAVRARNNHNIFIPWNQPLTPQSELLSADVVKILERSINLTVNPLTNPEGGVRGGLVVLEDIRYQ